MKLLVTILHGLSKLEYCKAMVKFGKFIFENVAEVKDLFDICAENPAYDFLARFLASVYQHKFSTCFHRGEPLSSLLPCEGEDRLKLMLDIVRNKFLC